MPYEILYCSISCILAFNVMLSSHGHLIKLKYNNLDRSVNIKIKLSFRREGISFKSQSNTVMMKEESSGGIFGTLVMVGPDEGYMEICMSSSVIRKLLLTG